VAPEAEEETSLAEPGEARVPPPVIAVPPPERAEATGIAAEDRAVKLGTHWRRRRFWITTSVYGAVWLLMIGLIHTDTSSSSLFLVFLLPFYAMTLLLVLRRPRALRAREKRTVGDRLTWTNKLSLSILTFIAIYLPFTFISNRIIPFAPMVEFFLFAAVLAFLYRIVGRSVGVAPSVEALPPASHRLHKQVILSIDDPHYQQTLFLNYEFVDKGRGAKTLAKRLENAMEAVGVTTERRQAIIDDLEHHHEGFHFGAGLTRRSRERNRGRRERRNQILRSVYVKFNQALEQST
jgi:hypothetical protein